MIVKILLISISLITTFIYLLILGANKNKTYEEIEIEDKEQIEYIKNYKSRIKIIINKIKK